jgi:hypothetical protein
MIDTPTNSLPHARNGAIKVAVTNQHRLDAAPDIPTVDEAGLPGFHFASGRRSGCRRARPRISSPGSTPPWSRPWLTPACGKIYRAGPGHPDARAAPQALRRLPQGQIESGGVVKAANIKAE